MPPSAPARITSQPHWRTKALTASMTTVRVGSARLLPANTLATCGTT